MNNITLGRYVPHNSFIHRLDPRSKLLGMILLMTTIFIRFTNVATNFIIYGVIAVIIFALMIIAKVSFKSFFKSLKSLWIMVIFLLIINLLIPNTGEFFMVFKTIKIYYNALYQTGYIFLRLILMLSLTTILTTTTRPMDLTYGLEWFISPLKIVRFPVHETAMTISLALRFIPTLLDETDRIMKAQASRGVDFVNGKIREKLRALVSLIVPLFISALQRSEELANAMEARGYNPSGKRTRYRIMSWRMRDTFSVLFLMALLAAVIYISVDKIDLVLVFSSLFKGGN